MFTFAILIGIYSYLIFALGLSGLLYKSYIVWTTVVYLLFCIFWHRRPLMGLPRRSFHSPLAMTSKRVFLGLIVSQAAVNLIGALGPELGFDALWYHLTLPKLYLENHSVFYFPGGLLYYSLMPKLTEMLYVAALALNGETLAKVIHFLFGILSSIALYKLSHLFFSPKISLVAVVIFYSNLVVGWQSITAYVDLARTFFEIMALWGFVKWCRNYERKWLMMSAIMLGLAISTKILALGSLIIFLVLIGIHSSLFAKGPPRRRVRAFGNLRGVRNVLVFLCISVVIPLPWLVFSYINTGNPVYPFFTDIYKVGLNVELLNPFRFISEVWTIFMESSDPISPIYIIFLPLIVILFKKFTTDIRLIVLYSFTAIVVWYFTPRTDGGRFILPYLPAFSIVAAAVIEKTQDKILRMALISVVIIISVISILYRGAANAKYVPVILGIQPKNDFLSKKLNFAFGDFYDTDGYFKSHIKPSDKVLLYGFHNLYYVDFPFTDSSWVKKGDIFNYIVTQNTSLPKKFKDWDLVYQNPETFVKLYSKGGIKWVY